MSILKTRESRRGDEIKQVVEVVSKEKTKRLTVEVPESKFYEFKALADKNSGSIRKAIDELIDFYIERAEK